MSIPFSHVRFSVETDRAYLYLQEGRTFCGNNFLVEFLLSLGLGELQVFEGHEGHDSSCNDICNQLGRAMLTPQVSALADSVEH